LEGVLSHDDDSAPYRDGLIAEAKP
jgi:hypothetical protein